MMRDKISFMIGSFAGGGAERVMITLANDLTNHGHSIDLVVVNNAGPLSNLVSKKVNVVDLKVSSVIFAIFPLIRYMKKTNSKALVSALEHVNLLNLMSNMLAGGQMTSIITIHSIIDRKEDSNIIKNSVVKILLRFLIKRAHGIVAVSKGAASHFSNFMNISESDIKIINNPVNLEKVLKLSNVKIKNLWLDDPSIEVIVSVGRLVKHKDYTTLILALRELRKKRNTRLIICGEGPQRQDLQGLIFRLNMCESVMVLGFVDNPYPLMKMSDLFVLSSNSESFGLVLVEALSLNCKIISTDCCCGPGEILEWGKWGKLIKVGDYEELAKCMYSELEKDGFTDVKERASDYNMNKVVLKYLEYINQKIQSV
jgi:glycosyltransferase involved in cell wall biosynthesis